MLHRLSVTALVPDQTADAQKLASALQLPWVAQDVAQQAWQLQYARDGLQLCAHHHPNWQPIRAHLVERVQPQQWRQSLLARAVGVTDHPTVIDVTAGLGTDGWTLRALGCAVIWIERSPIIAALLQDGLVRSGVEDTVVVADGRAILRDRVAADVVYLDPMYAHPHKSERTGKLRRVLRELVGLDEDADELLRVARAAGYPKIVVKRHPKAPHLASIMPTWSLRSKAVRFDVYVQA